MSEQSPTAAPQRLQPSASYSFTMRLHIAQQGNAFARVAAAIADAQALLGAIDLVRVERPDVVRAVTVACVDASSRAEAAMTSRPVRKNRRSSSLGRGELAAIGRFRQRRRPFETGPGGAGWTLISRRRNRRCGAPRSRSRPDPGRGARTR